MAGVVESEYQAQSWFAGVWAPAALLSLCDGTAMRPCPLTTSENGGVQKSAWLTAQCAGTDTRQGSTRSGHVRKAARGMLLLLLLTTRPAIAHRVVLCLACCAKSWPEHVSRLALLGLDRLKKASRGLDVRTTSARDVTKHRASK
jgi:hypothetical protein